MEGPFDIGEPLQNDVVGTCAHDILALLMIQHLEGDCRDVLPKPMPAPERIGRRASVLGTEFALLLCSLSTKAPCDEQGAG